MGRWLTSGRQSCGTECRGLFVPGLTAQNWGSPCKRLPSQTPPRTRPQPPSLWSPERSRRRLCSCCSAHEILMRERLAGGGAPTPGPRLGLLPFSLRPFHPTPYHLPHLEGQSPAGWVWQGVGSEHSRPRGTKGRALRRAQPPASRPAVLPWQRLQGWTPPRSAQAWRGARAAHIKNPRRRSLDPAVQGRRDWSWSTSCLIRTASVYASQLTLLDGHVLMVESKFEPMSESSRPCSCH